MSQTPTQLTPELQAYLLSISLREPESLARLRLESLQLPLGYMQVAPEVGQFLSLLIRLTGAQRVLEVGTFMGTAPSGWAWPCPQRGAC